MLLGYIQPALGGWRIHKQFWLKSNFGSESLLAVIMSLRFLVALSALWSVTAKLLIQKAAPNFTLDAAMPDDSTKSVSLADYKNKCLGSAGFGFVFIQRIHTQKLVMSDLHD